MVMDELCHRARRTVEYLGGPHTTRAAPLDRPTNAPANEVSMSATRSPHSPPDRHQLPHVAPGLTRAGDDSLADAVERLFSAFEAQIGLATILSVVRRCRSELDVISGPALPELLERRAHQRLTDLAARADQRRRSCTHRTAGRPGEADSESATEGRRLAHWTGDGANGAVPFAA